MFPRWRLVAFLILLLIAAFAVSAARAAKPPALQCWLAFVVVQNGQIRHLEPVQRIDCPAAKAKPKRKPASPLAR